MLNSVFPHVNLKIVLIFTVGFTLASIFGYLAHRVKLSPIVGYLIAGYFIGPYSPGFVADISIAEQLAEIGVILMMFSAGLHFKWTDFRAVKNIAVPGAFGQVAVAMLVVLALVMSMGWGLQAGLLLGLAIGVASTVVLLKMLADHKLLHTPEGTIAMGWLIVEDIITVIALLLIPTLAASMKGEGVSLLQISSSILTVIVKFSILVVFMFTLGRKWIRFILSKILHVPHELFTLVVLAITFMIATGSTMIFGLSIALGAFIAGMVMGRTDVRHKVSINTLPLRDLFIVIFFLAIGMLFNPSAVIQNPLLFIGILAIILLVKPVTAFFLVIFFKHPLQTALTVAIGLAQIGEFSFILAEQGTLFEIIPDNGFDIIVAGSIISIALNPLLFKLLKLKRFNLN